MTESQTHVTEALGRANTVLIVLHVHPDGDTTGSATALAYALKWMGKSVTLACSDAVGSQFQFLLGEWTVSSWDMVLDQRYDASVTVDCGDWRRVGNFEAARNAAPVMINIDHHQSNSLFGTINWVEPDANATAVLIYRLLQSMSVPLTPQIATALYCALSTDTGSFMYPHTIAESLTVASELVRLLPSLRQVNQALWAHRSWAQTRLIGWALSNLCTSPSRRVVWIAVPYATVLAYDVKDEDAEALIDWLRPIEGVAVALVFRELSGTGPIKVSWRSSQTELNVAEFARAFGGGGHSYASAAVLTVNLEQAETEVLSRLEDVIW
ncbi:MAG: DHH family phosphoesterase [Sulfobacillus sp.]